MALIYPTIGTAYFPVPKIACTSLKYFFGALEFGPEIAELDEEPLHQRFPTTAVEATSFDECQGLTSIAVIRDPVERLLSTYTNKIVDQDFLSLAISRHPEKMEWLQASGMDLHPNPNRFFGELDFFIQTFPTLGHHLVPIQTYIGTDLSRFDHLTMIENLDVLMNDYTRKFDQPARPQRRNKSSTRLSFYDLSKAARKALLKATESDYALLSQFYKPPSESARVLRKLTKSIGLSRSNQGA